MPASSSRTIVRCCKGTPQCAVLPPRVLAPQLTEQRDLSWRSTSERDPRENLALLLRSNHPDLIDLLLGLLEYDPAHRLTPEQALCHPFFDHAQCQPMRLLSQRPYRSSWFHIARAPRYCPGPAAALGATEPPATATRRSKLEPKRDEAPAIATPSPKKLLGPNTIVIRMPKKRPASELADHAAPPIDSKRAARHSASAAHAHVGRVTAAKSNGADERRGSRKHQGTSTSSRRKSASAPGRRARQRYGNQDDDDDDDDYHDAGVLQL